MKNTWIWIVVVVIVAVGGFILFQNMQAPSVLDQTPVAADTSSDTVTPVTKDTNASSTVASTTTLPMNATVAYSDTGFAPSTVTIAKGGTVTFTNTSNNKMNVASDPHPNHDGYDGTSRSTHCAPTFSGLAPFDQCKSGTTFTFTFTKSGSWGYHNHFNPNGGGTINVQ